MMLIPTADATNTSMMCAPYFEYNDLFSSNQCIAECNHLDVFEDITSRENIIKAIYALDYDQENDYEVGNHERKKANVPMQQKLKF